MKWRFLGAAAAVLTGAFALSAPSVGAVPRPLPIDTVTGVIVDAATNAPLAGVVVHLTDTSGADLPGLSTVTLGNGRFTILGADEEFGLRVDGGPIAYEIGWFGCDGAIYPFWGGACTHAPGDLGTIQLHTRRFTGVVVDSRTGVGVAGATVWLTDELGVKIPGKSVVTGLKGTFTLIAPTEEHGIIVDGTAVLHEVGYVTYAKKVAPGWGSAVTFAPGKLGRIQLDLLRPLPVAKLILVSDAVRSITATFIPGPTGGARTTYRLVCNGIVRTLTASGQTRAGFLPGLNRCSMTAENAVGRSLPVTAEVVVEGVPRRGA